MKADPTPSLSKWTDENVIDLLRKIRNDLIKDFLDERYLKDYVRDKYGVRELSFLKIEFIKSALKEMLISPVDADHYRALIKQIHETDTASLSEGNEDLFFKDVEQVLKRYIF